MRSRFTRVGNKPVHLVLGAYGRAFCRFRVGFEHAFNISQVDLEPGRVQRLDLFIHAVGLLQRRILRRILDGQQEHHGGIRYEPLQLCDIKAAYVLRQGGQCGAIVDRIEMPDIGPGQGEVVPAQDAEPAGFPQRERAQLPLYRMQFVFAEEILHGDGTQFDAEDFMALLCKPEHIQALAAERDEHAAAVSQTQSGPESAQQRIDCGLMEIGALVAPEFQPEVIVLIGARVVDWQNCGWSLRYCLCSASAISRRCFTFFSTLSAT